MWDGDAGYDAEELAVAGPRHRLVMGEGPWTFADDVVMGAG